MYLYQVWACSLAVRRWGYDMTDALEWLKKAEQIVRDWESDSNKELGCEMPVETWPIEILYNLIVNAFQSERDQALEDAAIEAESTSSSPMKYIYDICDRIRALKSKGG